MDILSSWFHSGPLPLNALATHYNLKLVALSYLIAIFASYVALDWAYRLRAENNRFTKLYWLFGGAFAMGAGIWSMHFVGMLALSMSMPMGYELRWTIGSLLVAIVVSGFALYTLRSQDSQYKHLLAAGILIGLGIATMHYTGMEGMRTHVNISYLPSLFFLSILIAIVAAEAALWFAMQTNRVSANKRFIYKLISALIMGIAICGMHYTGMAAAIFTPLSHGMHPEDVIPPTLLAYFITGITILMISLALTVSTYYQRMINAVENEKNFLNAILDNLNDFIIASDSEGKIILCNEAIYEFNGRGKSDHPHRNLCDYFTLYHKETKQEIADVDLPLTLALKGEKIRAQEMVLKFNNGIKRNVVIDGQPILDAHGKQLGAVIAIHDITELKESERLKNEFISVVSHELRTPLTSIKGSLSLLVSGNLGQFEPKANKMLTIANSNCERLLLLINDILDMEKIQAGKMRFQNKVIAIQDIIDDAIVANKMYGKNYDVTIKQTKKAPNIFVNADPDRLSQVMANLISNAVKFSHAGGVVSVSITNEGSFVRISVSDKGSGIPLEFQKKIFQKFSQADSTNTRVKGGTGLGLSITKAIIEKSGGELSFISKPDVGTTFYFTLPVYSPYDNEKLKTLGTAPASQQIRLLICEDDEDQAFYLKKLLNRVELDADIATTVGAAKKLLAHNQYHGLLLDLVLPDQDGISFIRELRANDKTRRLPIIVISVISNTGHTLLNGDAIGVLDWLDKPVEFKDLKKSLDIIKSFSKDTKPNILHVEDDLDTQTIISSLFQGSAHLTAVDNLGEAAHKLQSQNFDLVILDLLLRDGNGAELLSLIAKYKIPVVVYSATELDKDYAKYVTEAFVKSRISNEELVQTISTLLKINRVTNEKEMHF